jgi:hypothetical protein
VIRQVKDPFIRPFWAEEYAGYDVRFRREAIAPIQNKLGQFLLNPVIRNSRARGKPTLKPAVRGEDQRVWWREILTKLTAWPNCNAVGSLQA